MYSKQLNAKITEFKEKFPEYNFSMGTNTLNKEVCLSVFNKQFDKLAVLHFDYYIVVNPIAEGLDNIEMDLVFNFAQFPEEIMPEDLTLKYIIEQFNK